MTLKNLGQFTPNIMLKKKCDITYQDTCLEIKKSRIRKKLSK